MSQQININETIEEIRRVNSEEKASCLSFRIFSEKTKPALSKKTMLRPFDGKWTLACKAAGVTPYEARDGKYLKLTNKYSKEQIREKFEQIAQEMPDGLTAIEKDNPTFVRLERKLNLCLKSPKSHSVVIRSKTWHARANFTKACLA